MINILRYYNNGLWIKDNIDGKINIINASKLMENFLSKPLLQN